MNSTQVAYVNEAESIEVSPPTEMFGRVYVFPTKLGTPAPSEASDIDELAWIRPQVDSNAARQMILRGNPVDLS